MGKVGQGEVGHLPADKTCRQVEMKVLKEHDGGGLAIPGLGHNGLGKGAVHGHVAVFSGVVDGLVDVGRVGEVPHQVLKEPEQWVSEDAVVFVIDVSWRDHEAKVEVLSQEGGLEVLLLGPLRHPPVPLA